MKWHEDVDFVTQFVIILRCALLHICPCKIRSKMDLSPNTKNNNSSLRMTIVESNPTINVEKSNIPSLGKPNMYLNKVLHDSQDAMIWKQRPICFLMII